MFLLLAALAVLPAAAQEERPFDVKISNDEYKAYIVMNLYDKNLTVPGQEVLGEVEGYITEMLHGKTA